MAKDYNESAMYERSSKRRSIELRALRNYKIALKKGYKGIARKYKMEIEYISAREKYISGSVDNLRYERIRSRAERTGVDVQEIDKIIPEIPEDPKKNRILVYVR